MGSGGGGGGEKLTYNGRYPYRCSKFDPPLKEKLIKIFKFLYFNLLQSFVRIAGGGGGGK